MLRWSGAQTLSASFHQGHPLFIRELIQTSIAEPEDTLRDSPVDFDSAVAYALHPEMRRLIIRHIIGTLLLPVGTALFISPGVVPEFAAGLVRRLIGLAVALIGATFFVGGLVVAAFKLVADANILAEKRYGD